MTRTAQDGIFILLKVIKRHEEKRSEGRTELTKLKTMISCVYILLYSIKCIHNVEYKMYLQNETMAKL